jgi:hypothetical protein
LEYDLSKECGKSTLARHIAPERMYVSLDDPANYESANTDLKGFIGELPEFVTIEDVQRVPLFAEAADTRGQSKNS